MAPPTRPRSTPSACWRVRATSSARCCRRFAPIEHATARPAARPREEKRQVPRPAFVTEQVMRVHPGLLVRLQRSPIAIRARRSRSSPAIDRTLARPAATITAARSTCASRASRARSCATTCARSTRPASATTRTATSCTWTCASAGLLGRSQRARRAGRTTGRGPRQAGQRARTRPTCSRARSPTLAELGKPVVRIPDQRQRWPASSSRRGQRRSSTADQGPRWRAGAEESGDEVTARRRDRARARGSPPRARSALRPAESRAARRSVARGANASFSVAAPMSVAFESRRRTACSRRARAA